MASRRNGTLYVGVTSNLAQRVWQHKNNVADGFTSKYAVHDLVYCERHSNAVSAIQRKKQVKKSNRAWKMKMIEKTNPNWRNLYEEVCV